MYGRILAMTLVLFPGGVRTEAICDHVEVVHGELIVEDIPIFLRRRRAAFLAASAIHFGGIGGNGGRGCVVCGRGGPAQPRVKPPMGSIPLGSGRE
jgi:hypothetical protein